MVDCTIHLLSLKASLSANQVVSQLKANADHNILIAGVPHGWVHKPHKLDVDKLLSHEWHLFLLTSASLGSIQHVDSSVEAHVRINVSVPEEQWKHLATKSTPDQQHTTPQLPAEWIDQSTGNLSIPNKRINDQPTSTPAPGVLALDPPMAAFLSTALPKKAAQKPVSLFNLFKYRDNDSRIHEQYMQDFKRSFGDSAGAHIKFMGPVVISAFVDERPEQGRDGGWQEANLTHYDSVFHYAYMLSTDVYQGLNKDKVRGLEDTCILLVSEVELLHEG